MLPRTTELQQIHKVEVFPAGARPPSVDRGWGAVWIGPKSDSQKDWLISIFAGSRAVIPRADGKLCNKEGGDWSRRTWDFQRETEGFIQIDHQNVCFQWRTQQGFCCSHVYRSFCLQHLCEWLNKVLLRRGLCSAERLPAFVMWGYMEESQPSIGSLISQDWKMKHIHLYVSKEFSLMSSAMIGTPQHWKSVSNQGSPLSWASLISLFLVMHCPVAYAVLSLHTFLYSRWQLTHILWLLRLINPAKHFVVLV